MAKGICHDIISYVTTQMTEYRRRAMLRQKTVCRDRTWEECNKSTETNKINVATRLVSWMSTPGRTCRNIKAYVATLETKKAEILSQQGILCHDKKLKSNIGRILRQISLCCDILKNLRHNLCRDKIFSYRDIDYCNLEKLVETLYEEVLS